MYDNTTTNIDQLIAENELLRSRLAESEAMLEAIRNGEVDAIVVTGREGEKIFTLTSDDTPYRNIIEKMNEGVVTLTEDGLILYCNRRFAEIFSFPVEQIIGFNIRRFFNSGNISNYHTLLSKGIAGAKEETVYRSPRGDDVYLSLSLFLLPQEMLGKICIIVTDITELKRYQQELELLVDERTAELTKANKELTKINATKNKLFTVIGHDLRGSFTSLLGCSDLIIENLQAGNSMERFNHLLFHINSSAKSAFILLENLLIWARSQNDQLKFSPSVTSMNMLVDELIINMRSLATLKDISIKRVFTDDIEGFADENMLRAILRNLISNAIKFSHSGGSIEIDAVADQRGVAISVSDKGIGMSHETLEKLFRVGPNNSLEGTANEKGTGLGLLLCTEFVEKHRGKIWAVSKEGEGSTFWFTLPHP